MTHRRARRYWIICNLANMCSRTKHMCATTIQAFAPPMQEFSNRREFAAWCGLVPRQKSTGGRQILGRTSKMGQRDIRRLRITGAPLMHVNMHCRAVNGRHPLGHPERFTTWIMACQDAGAQASYAGGDCTSKQACPYCLGINNHKRGLSNSTAGCISFELLPNPWTGSGVI